MGTPQTDPEIVQLRDDLSKVLDQLVALASEIASNTPPPAAEARATIARILGPLAGQPGSAQANGDASGPPPTPAERAAKRDAKAFAGAFNGMEETRKHRRVDGPPGLWSNDMSAGKESAAIKKALGKHAPRGR